MFSEAGRRDHVQDDIGLAPATVSVSEAWGRSEARGGAKL